MRAARLHEIGKPLSLDTLPSTAKNVGQELVNARCAALNRRDYWMQKGLYPGITLPITPGSDGSGVANGKEVIINPGLEWGESETVQSGRFRILGMPDPGTFAEEVVVPEENIFSKPLHLTMEQAAALPLAGVTAYRALFVQGEATSGDRIMITGIGGGVALMAMQFALEGNMEVAVTSGSPEKMDRAMAMGASAAFNYKEADWVKRAVDSGGEFDLVIDSAGGERFGEMLRLVRPGGRLVIYGGTAGKIQNLSPQILFWRQLSIVGSTMGSPSDFRNMLSFVNAHRITPIIDKVYPLDEINDAIAHMAEGNQFGKIVIRITQ